MTFAGGRHASEATRTGSGGERTGSVAAVERRDEIDALRADRDAAVAAAQEAEREVGRLRGQVAEMQVQLVRARQDQERYQRLFDAYRVVREAPSRLRRWRRRR